MSHPTWVRGLKLIFRNGYRVVITVAPYVGAWIETRLDNANKQQQYVAPYVGAWIETSKSSNGELLGSVAPYVGAWIET